MAQDSNLLTCDALRSWSTSGVESANGKEVKMMAVMHNDVSPAR
jgi:hypothetical protein